MKRFRGLVLFKVNKKAAKEGESGIKSLFPRIFDLVSEIPAGQVSTYGQIAFICSAPTARVVGFAVAGLPDGSDVPWHRVVNSMGKLSPRKDGVESLEQRRRLHEEGVFLDKQGRVDFKSHAWSGPSWAWLAAHGYDLDDLALKSTGLKRQGIWSRWPF